MTPGTLSKSDSVHQKQPPAKIAVSMPTAGFAGASSSVTITADEAKLEIAATTIASSIFGKKFFTSSPQCRQRTAIQNKFQRKSVIAKAVSGWFRAVIKKMSLMATAAGAVVFRAGEYQFEIGLLGDMPFNRICKARPPRAAIEFCIAAEQGKVAGGAYKRTTAVLVI